jgi:hypothetical protein
MSRLDLRCAEGTLQAAIHFNYPPVGSWAYELTPTVWTNRIELVGYAVVAFDLSHEIWGADMWRNIVVGLNSGAVNGIFIAAGESSWYRWDTFGARDWVWAGGTMEVDTSPPVIWPSPIERKAGPPDKLLPWDEVSVAMSEPLEEEQIVAGLSLVRADLPDQPSGQLAWQFPVSTSHGVASWPGASWAKTRLSSWTTDAAHEHTTHLLQPVFDPAGNSGSIATQWTIVALPETLLSLDFSTEAALYPWGPVRREMGSVQQGTLCDERDCMIVGPVGYGQGWASPGACIERAGFAARLRTDQAQAIRVTLRLFEAMKSFGSIFSATFHIDVILADGTRIKALLDPTGHWLEPSWEVPPELQPATEWFDIVIPLNAQSDEVAIVVWAGADSKSDCFNYEGDYYAMAIDAVEAVAAVQ